MLRITWVLLAIAAGCAADPVRPDVELTVSFHILSTGTGKIAAGLGGIDCPPDCVARFDQGSSVVLAVFPDPNSVFLSWSGGCSGNQHFLVQLDADIACVARLNLKPPGGTLAARGSLVFDHRIEAGLLRNGLIWTAGFDLAEGNVVDISNPDNPASRPGAEFGPCLGATGLTVFFSPLPQYLQDVIHTTCTLAGAGTLAPTGNGLSQQETYGFEPGEVVVLPGTPGQVMVDFEFGQLRLVDRGVTPGMDVVIPLSSGLHQQQHRQSPVSGRNGLAHVRGDHERG